MSEDLNDVSDLLGAEPPGTIVGLTYEEREDEFIRLLRQGCTVRQAAAAVAINFSTLYRKRAADAAFHKRWEDAQRIRVDHLVAEAERRAIRGSDKLLIFLLQSYDPARFRHQSSLDLTNSDGSLRAEAEDNDAAARSASLFALARARKAAKEIADLL
jgi:hypothetical protein